jgi:ribosomal protein S27E
MSTTPASVIRCLICGHRPIETKVDGRFVTTFCPGCLAVLLIEFDPPDQPGLRARIERIDELE